MFNIFSSLMENLKWILYCFIHFNIWNWKLYISPQVGSHNIHRFQIIRSLLNFSIIPILRGFLNRNSIYNTFSDKRNIININLKLFINQHGMHIHTIFLIYIIFSIENKRYIIHTFHIVLTHIQIFCNYET